MPKAHRHQPRRVGDQFFKKNEVKRLISIAREREIKKYRIVVGRENDHPTYALVVDETASADSDGNPWDEVLTDAAN
jgi:hypothetical protein